jgi:uncharacterized protein (TIGR02996 family)
MSHPDADAFVQTILRDLADVTTRLVFADWLEETGEPSNVAWAHFIRLMAATPHTPGMIPYENLDRQSSELARAIRATLTIDAAQLVGRVEHLWQLLPRPNITVKLAGFVVSQAAIELVPESVARENLVLALRLEGRRLLIATADPANPDTLQKLQFILNKDIVPVRAAADDILAATNYHYGQTETESVDSISYESPLISLEDDPVSFTIAGVFVTAFSQHEYGRACDRFEIEQTAGGASVVYLDGTNPVASERLPRSVFTRLLDHFLSLPVDAEYTANGFRCLDFDIPLLSGRRFPATLQRRPIEGETTWYRVRFRWEDRE